MAVRVRRSIDRAEAMIEALLVLAISDQGAVTRELLDLSAVAEDALELAAPGIARLGLTVRAELAPAETTGDQAAHRADGVEPGRQRGPAQRARAAGSRSPPAGSKEAPS